MHIAQMLALVCLLVAATDARRARRSAASIYSVQERLAMVLDFSDITTTDINDNVNAVKTSIQASASSINAAADAVTTASAAQLDARTAALSTSVSSMQASVSALTPALSSAVSTMTVQVATETAARQAAGTTLTAQVAAIDASVTAGIAAAVADRSTIKANRVTDTILATVSAQLVAAVSTENSRAVVEAAGQSTAVSSVRPSFSTTTKAAISTEASRADAACANIAVGSSFTLSTKDGSLDNTACTVEGVIYYSLAGHIAMVCSDGFYTPISFVGSFIGSKAISTAQAASLMQVLGQYTGWTRCYVMSVDGASSSTWHTKCDAKGPTVILAKTNTNAFGGYNGQGWTSRGGYYVTSIRSMMWRFNVNTFEGVYPTQYPYYAHYDSNSYGPTYGGGHDWYTPSNMNTPSFNPHSYAGLSYSSSFLAGTSSVTITELEAWIRTG